MNRRVALLISVIALNLMACCCGGFGNGSKPKAADLPPIAEPTPIVPEPVSNFKFPEAEPIFTFKPKQLPKRKFDPAYSSNARTTVDNVTVRMSSASVEGDLLLIKLIVANNGIGPIKYDPWNSAKGTIGAASDEHGGKFQPAAFPASQGTALTAPATIQTGSSIVDFIAFKAATVESQELDVRLSARNVGMVGHIFKFRLDRQFFAFLQDTRLAMIEEQRQRTDFKSNVHTPWKARFVAAREKFIADAATEAERKREIQFAKLEADRAERRKLELQIEAARMAEIEALRPKVTRQNYHKIPIGMAFNDVFAILGNEGREFGGSANGVQTIDWVRESNFFDSGCFIRIIFFNGRVDTKFIVGD